MIMGVRGERGSASATISNEFGYTGRHRRADGTVPPAPGGRRLSRTATAKRDLADAAINERRVADIA